MTRFRGRGRGVVCLLTAVGFASACASTAPIQRSALQEKIDRGGIGATELRLRLYELPAQLGAVIETAADRIRAESSDPAVRHRALLWKADGIPALYAAALRPDPMAGALDLWLLVEQMNLYFREGAGKDAFGAQQPLANAAVERMLAITEETAVALTPDPATLERRAARVADFARSHPIEGAFSARDTALIELARLSGAEKGNAFASVGQATETLSDISLRLNAYVTLVPKVGRWQAELAAEDITGRDSLRRALDDFQAVGDAARRADRVFADIAGTVREAGIPMQEMLDRQRDELLAATDRERIAVMAFISAERESAFAALSEERKAALESIGRERAAVLTEVDALAKRSIDDASDRARGIIDYVFGRVLILVVTSAVLFAVGYRFARKPRTRGGVE